MQQNIDTYDFTGKKAIVRVDFNVPLNEKLEITDDTRIRAAIPTLKKVLEKGGSLIIMSHLGRPKGVTDKFSLRHIIGRVQELLGVPVKFADDCMKADEQVAALKPGEVLVLENLRFYAEEEGKPRGLADDATDDEKKAAKAAVKESQKKFVEKLASYADCYINDAFGTAHRAGEIKAIDRVLKTPEHPVTAIIGGAKVSSKIGIIEHLFDVVDNMIIGGGMVYTFIKAQGGKIGKSLCEDDQLDLALNIMKKAEEKGVKLYLSKEVVIADAFSNDANTKICANNEIPDEWEGVDAAPSTLAVWEDVIMKSKTILWNGPVGVFEIPAFAKGTNKDACKGDRERSVHSRGRRRFCGCRHPDGLCEEGQLCIHRRRCDARIPRRQGTSGYCGNPRIIPEIRMTDQGDRTGRPVCLPGVPDTWFSGTDRYLVGTNK